MLPEFLDLPFSNFAYFVEVRVKSIRSACIGIGCGTSPLGLQVIIQVIPQSQDLVRASEIWYWLMSPPLFSRSNTVTGGGSLVQAGTCQ